MMSPLHARHQQVCPNQVELQTELCALQTGPPLRIGRWLLILREHAKRGHAAKQSRKVPGSLYGIPHAARWQQPSEPQSCDILSF